MDSRGYTELSTPPYCWTISPCDYAAAARRYVQEIGGMAWASIQDWMCEPWIIANTGLSVREHQQRTIASYLDLQALAPDVPWTPVLQGWRPEDYLDHVEQYDRAGIDLRALPIVGVGSVCRRQSTSVAELIFRRLHGLGIRLHAFGFKVLGYRRTGAYIDSGDSMAWSFHGRKNPPCVCSSPTHKNGANCLAYALDWYQRLLSGLRFSPLLQAELLW